MNFPEEIDLVWLAVDEVGNLAAMITGGAGPIPSGVLAHGDKVLDIEQALLALPSPWSGFYPRSGPEPQ
jgi:spore maturation protein SpmA